MTTHLPIATRFCSARIPLDLWFEGDMYEGEMAWFVDGNSKITVGNGSYAEPKPNAFSLPAASVEWDKPYDSPALPPACPGSTSICRGSCYVKGLAKHDPELYGLYTQNLRVLQALLDLGGAYADHGADVLAKWIRTNAPAGFRWHVSGDVLNVDHAAWIADVCELAPDVPFWIYTRTLDVVGILMTPNLAVNISADRENLEAARRVAYEYGARICYLSDDGHVPELPEGSVIFPDYDLRGRNLPEPTSAPWWQGLTHEQRAMTCPTDFFGQSEAHRCGPCTKCLVP